MPQPSPSQSTLTVLGGPLDGTSLVLDDVADEALIGSDTGCHLCLELPGVSPIHARVWMDSAGVTVINARSPRGIYVNDDTVADQAPLRDGDILWLGPPGDDASVMLQCRIAPPTAARSAIAPVVESFGAEDLLEAVPEPTAPEAAAPADEFLIEEPQAVAAPPQASPTAEPPAPEPEEIERLILEAPVEAAVEPAFEPPVEPAVEAPAEVVDDAFFVAEAPLANEAVPAEADEIFVVEDPVSAPPPATPPPAPPAPAPPSAPPAAAAIASKPSAPAPRGVGPAPKPAAAAPPAARPAVPRPATPKYDASLPEMAPSRERVPPAVGEMPAPGKPKAKARPKPAAPIGRYAAIGAGALLVLGGGGYFAMRFLSAPQLASLSPARAKVGQAVTLTGKNFAPDKSGSQVLFGDKTAKVTQASAAQLQVEVPEIPTAAGRDTKVPVTVQVAGRVTQAVEIALFQTPRIHGLSPDVAMPGEELSLAGTGWGPGVVVKFGTLPAEVVQTGTTSIRVRVPALDGAQGTSYPVVATMGADESNSAPFLVGRLPLLKGVEPASVSAGEIVTVPGRGFHTPASANVVHVGGVRALVVSARESELKVVVPRVAAGGATALEVRVPGTDAVGQATLTVAPPEDPVDFRFVAEPYDDAPGHEHAVLSSGVGPVFVLAPSGGKSAAERAVETARRLNEAAVSLKASRDADVEARNAATNPVLALVGKEKVLLEIAQEDAAAYDEDWTKLGGKGGPVTRGRLATWWTAVARDLVLLLVRGEKPRHAAGLAPEGRILGDVFEAARKTGRFGVPRQVVSELKPAQRDALRTLSLRVPAAVTGPAAPGSAAAVAATLKLEGTWSGSEREGGGRRYITVAFRGSGGSLTYTGGVSVGIPFSTLEAPQKGAVRFSVAVRGTTRYYIGRWDGEKITGRIASDPAGKTEIGTFEIVPGL